MRLARIGLGVATAGLALLVGTASAIPCPEGTVERWVCTQNPPSCVIVCLPAFDPAAITR